MVDLSFATSQVDPAERLSATRELVNREFLPLAITPLRAAGPPAHFDARLTGGDWGGLRVWRVEASPLLAARAPRHITLRARDDYLLALHVSGTATGVQDDRQVILGPGDFALFDPTRPYTIAFQGAGTFEHVIYQVPRASLDARGQAGNMTALRVPAASSAGRLVSPCLRTLAWSAGPAGDPPALALIDAGLDLAASALRAAAGVGGHQDSRRRMLRRCRDELADQQHSYRTVAEIAARWGFRSPAHFTRAFRARYGVVPVEFRRLASAQDRPR